MEAPPSMPTRKSIVIFAALVQAILAAKKAEPEPPKVVLADYVMDMANDIMGACMAVAKDGAGLVMGAPRFGVDIFLWGTAHLRSVPGVVVNVYNGDEATLDGFTSFCVYAAGVIFSVYASVTALNLVLSLFATVKDYFSGYLVLPNKVAGQKLPEPLAVVRGIVQTQILDRVRSFKVDKWIIPLEGSGSGAPTLKGATASLATAVSACMILSSAPAVHGLMKGGADKSAAEALAYTLGTALGVQYLVKISA